MTARRKRESDIEREKTKIRKNNQLGGDKRNMILMKPKTGTFCLCNFFVLTVVSSANICTSDCQVFLIDFSPQ